MSSNKNILMVSAENDALAGCKVGGIGDVVRDIPPALAQYGWKVMVVTPSYGFLHKQGLSRLEGSAMFSFGSKAFKADLYVVSENIKDNIIHYVVDNAEIFPPVKVDNRFQIYCHDPPEKPFATDATRYAFFCKAVAEFIIGDQFKNVDFIHLHDWHSAFLLILREFHSRYDYLKKLRTVYTIHNLSIQGTRPVSGDKSSLMQWYPELKTFDSEKLSDPVSPACINPMAIGIRLSDRVHTVSPTYAQEILKPSIKPQYYGGEGLEKDLQIAFKEKRLFGILNGSNYSSAQKSKKMKKEDMFDFLSSDVLNWTATRETLASAHFIAYTRLKELSPEGKTLLTSIGRIVEQKYFLLKTEISGGKTALESLLESIKNKGVYILLGTGAPEYEDFLLEISAGYKNFIFLNSYSDRSAETLYQNGDLFIMPSLFEPCGIAQMIAMSYGQLCVASEVGGLKDTVKNGINGFSFSGNTVSEKAENLVKTCIKAIDTKTDMPAEWRKLKASAKKSRFLWKDSVKEYIDKLYVL